jgi:hypothetical protein
MKWLVTLALLICHGAYSQSILPGIGPGQPLRLLASDSMVLELQEPRRELPCTVTPLKPQLGFDFVFHTGYRVIVPMKELAGTENMLTVLFRVTPAVRSAEPVYFTQKVRVPFLKEDQAGSAALTGAFVVGAGRYHIDWLMRDRGERFCAGFWDVDARFSAKEASVASVTPKNAVQAEQEDPFAEDYSTSGKRTGQLLNVIVIANFAPSASGGATPNARDVQVLSAILRRISHEPSIGKYSTVACSLQAKQVMYRQEAEQQINLSALGKALTPSSFATVNVDQLTANGGYGDFLGALILEELDKEQPDAVIVVSPDSDVDLKMSHELVTRLQTVPVFYLNYKTTRYVLSDDAIGRAVKRLRGREYTISEPRELLDAWTDIVSRMSRGTRP